MGQKERAVLSRVEVCNYFLPHDGGVFLKVAAHLWETELNAQLGPFLEVILECMAALRPGTVC